MAANRKRKPVEQVRSHTRRVHKAGVKPNPNQAALDLTPVQINAADEVLQIAQEHITLRSTYDTKAGTERSFKRVATVFNALTGHNLDASDVAMLQTVLKQVRWQTAKEAGKAHLDSAVDGAAYFALAHEELEDAITRNEP